MHCESGGIGRRTRLRIWRGNPWGFESPLSHHFHSDGAAFETRYSVSVPGGDNTTSERGRVGLCADCRYMRKVESARGSTFYFCERSTIDPNFPKYPRLPVIQCSGHEPHISLLGDK